jgi:hypothetical protein
MKKWLLSSVVGLGLFVSACSSTPSKPATTTTTTGGAYAVLAPATTPPAYKECTTQIAAAADGTATPLQCADGAINTTAWSHYATADPKMLGLGKSATSQQVIAALCAGRTTLSAPIQQDSYLLARVYYGWPYGSDLATNTLVTKPSSCG